MMNAEQMAAEYGRLKHVLESAGYKVAEYGFESLIVIEMFVLERRSGKKLVRKQEGIAFQGRTAWLVERHKLAALERLAYVVPRMLVARILRTDNRAGRK